MKRFITQTGIGDSIFALPLAMALEAEKINAEIHTCAPEFFAGLEYIKAVKVPAWDSEENRNFDGVRLKYDRYRGSYFDSYYHAHGLVMPLDEAQETAACHLRELGQPSGPLGEPPSYAVVGMPRLPARHKAKKQLGDSGAPERFRFEVMAARQAGLAIVSVGKDEAYTHEIQVEYDLTNQLTLLELINVVANAKCVISQISMLTAMASCLGVPVKFIPGVHETPERFERHVHGVTWKKNLRAEAQATV